LIFTETSDTKQGTVERNIDKNNTVLTEYEQSPFPVVGSGTAYKQDKQPKNTRASAKIAHLPRGNVTCVCSVLITCALRFHTAGDFRDHSRVLVASGKQRLLVVYSF